MKKTISFVVSLICTFLLVGCGNDDKPIEKEKSSFEKTVFVLENFDVHNTNGYDYSLKQYIGNDVANSHEIVLRADFTQDTKAKKVESAKKLNDFSSNEQYSYESVTTYFYNNRIAEFKNDSWKWSSCKEKDYLNCNLNNFKFDASYFENIKESTDDFYTFKANVVGTKINDFFGTENCSFEEVTVTIKVNTDFSSLSSVLITYFQSKTYTEFSFAVYKGAVSIDLPQ